MELVSTAAITIGGTSSSTEQQVVINEMSIAFMIQVKICVGLTFRESELSECVLNKNENGFRSLEKQNSEKTVPHIFILIGFSSFKATFLSELFEAWHTGTCIYSGEYLN